MSESVKKDIRINERLRSMMFDSKMNASEFARKVGVSPQVMNNIVGNRLSKPGFDILEKIVTAMQVDANWLLTGEGSPYGDRFEEDGTRSVTESHAQQSSLEVCQKEVELLRQRISDKDELIVSLKAQIEMATGTSSKSA